MSYDFFCGVDVTPDGDQVTLALIERQHDDQEDRECFRIRRIEQLDGGAPDAAADRAQDLVAQAPYAGRTVHVVNTGLDAGQAVADAIDERGLTPLGVTVTGGDAAGQDEVDFFVSEHELVSSLQDLYRSGRFRPGAEKTEYASQVLYGLQSYRADAPQAGDALNEIDQAPARDAAHAPLVLSAALACWAAEHRALDPSEHLAGDAPPLGAHKRS